MAPAADPSHRLARGKRRSHLKKSPLLPSLVGPSSGELAAAGSQVQAPSQGGPAVSQSVPGACSCSRSCSRSRSQLSGRASPTMRLQPPPLSATRFLMHRRGHGGSSVSTAVPAKGKRGALLTAQMLPPSRAVAHTTKPQPVSARIQSDDVQGSLRRGHAVHCDGDRRFVGTCRQSVIQRGNRDGKQLGEHRGR